MPSPEELLEQMQEDPPDTAEEFKDTQERAFNQAAQQMLNPSERERVRASFDVEGDAGDDQRLLLMQFDLTSRADRFQVEEILAYDEVSPAGSNMKWVGQTCYYYLYLQVPPSFYERARSTQLSNPALSPLSEAEPEPTGMTPYEGWLRRVGRAIDRVVEDVCLAEK
jgi:hypothetical protein